VKLHGCRMGKYGVCGVECLKECLHRMVYLHKFDSVFAMLCREAVDVHT